MKTLLLSIIAINLTFISFNLAFRAVEPIQAEVSRYDIESAIQYALDGCDLIGSGDNYYFSC
ncbi:uncharacterized protein METZ01_LOCUS340039 [marine metagenome]|uniref:Uncharacterized protein n=1 Tax=marine metagenome TaxID=408172 RepID=A0A382QQK6_9ZZZZ